MKQVQSQVQVEHQMGYVRGPSCTDLDLYYFHFIAIRFEMFGPHIHFPQLNIAARFDRF